ncbi:MAG: iron-sulfur cluster assembly scaffold protein [Nitrososphaerales archaeon]
MAQRDASVQRKIGYSEKVIEHFTNPRNVGRLDDADVTAKVGSVACGDLIKLYLKIDERTERIEKITFESYGCAANIATSSMLTELAKGKTLEEARKITFKDIAEELGGLPKIKMHCAVLSKTGLDAAISKYYAMKGKTKIDDTLVKLLLKGVLDPITGVDIISGKTAESISVQDHEVTIGLRVEEGSKLAAELEGDIREAFEGLPVSIKILYKGEKGGQPSAA